MTENTLVSHSESTGPTLILAYLNTERRKKGEWQKIATMSRTGEGERGTCSGRGREEERELGVEKRERKRGGLSVEEREKERDLAWKRRRERGTCCVKEE